MESGGRWLFAVPLDWADEVVDALDLVLSLALVLGKEVLPWLASLEDRRDELKEKIAEEEMKEQKEPEVAIWYALTSLRTSTELQSTDILLDRFFDTVMVDDKQDSMAVVFRWRDEKMSMKTALSPPEMVGLRNQLVLLSIR